MRIWYCVAGEGRGHAYRSIPIVNYLREKHVVDVFAGDVSFPLLRVFSPKWIVSLRIVYSRNSVSNVLTSLFNLVRLPLFVMSFFRLVGYVLKNRPDVLITDFEPLSNYVAKILRIPILTVDNEEVILTTDYDVPSCFFWNAWKVRCLIRLISPFASRRLVPTFFYLPVRDVHTMLVSPVVRREIGVLQSRVGGHVVVYQTSQSNVDLLPALLLCSKTHFVVYGFDRDEKIKNVEFKRDGFLKNLASCSAVITNGGFTLMSEALFLRKPVLSLPVLGQFEQVLNGLYLEKQGYGMCSFSTSSDVIEDFLRKKEVFRKNLQRLPKISNKSFFAALENALSEVKSE